MWKKASKDLTGNSTSLSRKAVIFDSYIHLGSNKNTEGASNPRYTFNFLGLKEYSVASIQAVREGDRLTVLGWFFSTDPFRIYLGDD